MASRTIRSHKESITLSDSLTSLLTIEALNPSKEIYIISPWVTNSKIMDNTSNNYSDLFHLGQGKNICLADVLYTYAFRGSNIKIICNPHEIPTKEFINIVKNKGYIKNIEFRHLDKNHEKGMVTDNFYVHGSMNFTYNGIHINGEKVRITTEKSEVSAAILETKARWEESKTI